MNLPCTHFHYCPRCSQPAAVPSSEAVFHCARCGFVLFFNPAVAGAAFLRHEAGAILFLRRAKEPARGKLGLPGGFIDYGETAEQGLRREIREEIGLETVGLEFLCSRVNHYDYQGTTYPVVDLFFTVQLPAAATPRCLDGVDALQWVKPQDVDPDSLAFPSLRGAFQHLMALDISA